MRANENVNFSNISATTAAFVLRGGNYLVEIVATWGGGSVTLQRMAMDGSTYLQVLTPFTANAVQLSNLPSGTYKFAVTTAAAVYAEIARIPAE
jgi:hypothetical protein